MLIVISYKQLSRRLATPTSGFDSRINWQLLHRLVNLTSGFDPRIDSQLSHRLAAFAADARPVSRKVGGEAQAKATKQSFALSFRSGINGVSPTCLMREFSKKRYSRPKNPQQM
jgi:hypothetical protein